MRGQWESAGVKGIRLNPDTELGIKLLPISQRRKNSPNVLDTVSARKRLVWAVGRSGLSMGPVPI